MCSSTQTIPALWFDCFPKRPFATLRLVCFHHLGANSGWSRKWSEHLPDNWEVCSVILPGHGKRNKEPLPQELTKLAEQFAVECSDYLATKPFIVLGNSLGALLGYECIVSLQNIGGPLPEHFFPCACAGPQYYHDPDDVKWPFRFESAPRDILIDFLRKLGGTSPEILAHQRVSNAFTLFLSNMLVNGYVSSSYSSRWSHDPNLSFLFCQNLLPNHILWRDRGSHSLLFTLN